MTTAAAANIKEINRLLTLARIHANVVLRTQVRK
jgi:hypothetical protein